MNGTASSCASSICIQQGALDAHLFDMRRDLGLALVTELPAAGFDDADQICRGGFGIVYRCQQVGLDRTVAVKVLTADVDENRERFCASSAQWAGSPDTPNIVGVPKVGETTGG